VRENTNIEGCYVLSSPVFLDNRGWLTKVVDQENQPYIWTDDNPVAEVFWSESVPGVFRGLHLQLPPHAVRKIVFCITGEIRDYVVDLRIDSPTYLETFSAKLGQDENLSKGVVVPAGCAHGFFVPVSRSIVLYLQSGPRDIQSEAGLNVGILDQREFLKTRIRLSDRDLKLPSIDDFPRLTKSEWEARE